MPRPTSYASLRPQLGDGGAITVQHVLDDDTPEHEPLLDYLFSPDVALQQALEGILVAQPVLPA